VGHSVVLRQSQTLFLFPLYCSLKHPPAWYQHYKAATDSRQECRLHLARSYLKSKTSLGLLAAYWPGFELLLLEKLLRQEVSQIAGYH
jgi:hypothetical protein